jgi:hypothetical protein
MCDKQSEGLSIWMISNDSPFYRVWHPKRFISLAAPPHIARSVGLTDEKESLVDTSKHEAAMSPEMPTCQAACNYRLS